MKKILCIVLATAFLLALFACGQAAAPPENVNSEPTTTDAASTTSGAIVEAFQIEKTPLEHTNAFSFSWSAPKSEATLLEYLTPQLPEIFDKLDIEHEGRFVVLEGEAKRLDKASPSGRQITMMRQYCIHTKEQWIGISLLCFSEPSATNMEEIRVHAQIVSEFLSMGGTDFWFADFDGDEREEVFAVTNYGFGDRLAAKVGVFSFTEEGWGKPLFWAYRGDYDFGFKLLETKDPYVIKNNITGYRREIELVDGFYDDDETLQNAEVYGGAAVDVDGDGVYEMVVTQSPFKWHGQCYSLLRYNKQKKCFQTEYAAYLAYGEFEWETNEGEYGPFLKQAGYDGKNVKFKD